MQKSNMITKICMGFLLLLLASNYAYGQNPNSDLRSSINYLLDQLKGNSMDAVLFWNLVAMEASANDFNPSITATPQQNGPTYSSRALAIIHGAMYDAFNYFQQPCKMLTELDDDERVKYKDKGIATVAAIMEAGYQTLLSLFSEQKALFHEIRAAFLQSLDSDDDDDQEVNVKFGINIGQKIARAILKERSADRSDATSNYTARPEPGYHRADPTVPNQLPHAPHWGNVVPFIIDSSSQFRSENIIGDDPKSRQKFLNSKKYRRNLVEVKCIGERNSSIRTDDQTEIGYFWAYDGGIKIGVPPRLYNQVVRTVAIKQKNTLARNAQLFALVNFALADACIAAWETKYYYDLWRPIIGIREGIRKIRSDPDWVPLGAPRSNGMINFTPGFPSYPSGHSTFGSACFEMLRLFYGTDNISFDFQSDEFNGKTFDALTKKVRPVRVRRYRSFTEAEMENFLGRIYLGIHWRIDQTSGRTMGRKVASFIYKELM